MSTVQSYVASRETVYRYPTVGDPAPPRGAKVLLLTLHGICIEGTWPAVGCIGWAPLPGRDKEKEALL